MRLGQTHQVRDFNFALSVSEVSRPASAAYFCLESATLEFWLGSLLDFHRGRLGRTAWYGRHEVPEGLGRLALHHACPLAQHHYFL